MKANNTAHVLLLDADPNESRLIQQTLTRATPGFRCKVDIVSTPKCAEKRLRQGRFDDIIVNLPTDNGEDLKTIEALEFITAVAEGRPNKPDFGDALAAASVAAAMVRSWESERWEDVVSLRID